MNCRFCGAVVSRVVLDLVNAPPSNAYLTESQLEQPEIYYPLKVFVCDRCSLVQLAEEKKSSEIFSEGYVYFSSYSTSWLKHAEAYVAMACERFALGSASQVMEVASNDGYLLQYFVKRGIPCFGVEPSSRTAAAARERNVQTIESFFGVDLAKRLVRERGTQDLILGNNVLAHVPDINDFVEGLKVALSPEGTVTMEFPHLLNLIRSNQFDTIYHEHFSYLSLKVVRAIFAAHGLELVDVEELTTHGGSLRIFAMHRNGADRPISLRVERVIDEEEAFGLERKVTITSFQDRVSAVRADFLDFLLQARTAGKMVAAYGAAAKGNTLLNYCGVAGTDLIRFVVDASPHKQGLFLPGSHIPVVGEKELKEYKPDYIVIFPWNLREEITTQLSYVRGWQGCFVTAIPELEVF